MKKMAYTSTADVAYDSLLSNVVSLLEAAGRTSAKAVNHIITATYWEIGRRIIEQEQRGSRRAEYGERLIKRLAEDLTTRFGRGFSRSNLLQMRQFFLAHRQKDPDTVWIF